MGISDDKLTNMFSKINSDLGSIKQDTKHINEHLQNLNSETEENTQEINNLPCEKRKRKIDLMFKGMLFIAVMVAVIYLVHMPIVIDKFDVYSKIARAVADLWA